MLRLLLSLRDKHGFCEIQKLRYYNGEGEKERDRLLKVSVGIQKFSELCRLFASHLNNKCCWLIVRYIVACPTSPVCDWAGCGLECCSCILFSSTLLCSSCQASDASMSTIQRETEQCIIIKIKQSIFLTNFLLSFVLLSLRFQLR